MRCTAWRWRSLWNHKSRTDVPGRDIGLYDFSQYSVGLRSEMYFDKSNAPGWATDSQSYRAIVRVDGQGRWSKPFTPKAGSTLSWCVVLESR